jgi:hypothetical protein
VGRAVAASQADAHQRDTNQCDTVSDAPAPLNQHPRHLSPGTIRVVASEVNAYGNDASTSLLRCSTTPTERVRAIVPARAFAQIVSFELFVASSRDLIEHGRL